MTSAAIAAQRLGGRRTGASSAKRRSRGLAAPIAWLHNRMPRIRPFKTVTVALFSVALVGIVANAMMFQRGRHPSPLFGFGQSIDGVPDAPPSVVAILPPAPAPAERTGTLPPVPAALPAPSQAPEFAPPILGAVPKSAPAKHTVSKTHHEDGIGGLLKAQAHPRPGHSTGQSARTAETSAKASPSATHRAAADSEDKTDLNHHIKAGDDPAPRPRHHVAEAGPTAPKATPEVQ